MSASPGAQEAQSDGTRDAARTAAYTAAAKAYRADVEALCAEAMAGRGIGQDGGERAIAFLASAMADIGLRPAGPGAGAAAFRSPFAVDDPAPAICLPGTACRLTVAGEEVATRTGTEAVPFRFSSDGPAAAAVVFAGHGLTIPELGLDDYAGLDVKGRVVLVLRGGPAWRTEAAPVRAHRQELAFRAKAERARQLGAVAFVCVDREDGREETPASMALRVRGEGVALPCLWLGRTAAARLFREGERGLVAVQAALDGGSAPQSLAPSPLVDGARLALRVELGGRARRLDTANVIGLVPGTCERRQAEFVVLGAHHDHLGLGEYGSLAGPGENGRIHPGADDNASGTAGVLALARRLKARPTARTVVVVAFGAEEFGQLGSRHFLEHGPVPKDAIVAMLDLNMIGRGASGQPGIYGVDSGDGLRAVVAAASADRERGLRLRPWSSYRSDQSTFLQAGIPALLLTTGLHDQYHRPGDIPDLIEYDAALGLIDLAEKLVRVLGDAEQRPAFQPQRGK